MEIKAFYLEDITTLARKVSEVWEFKESPRLGFELIGKGLLPEFSSDDEKYYYFLFRKQIG